MSPRVNFTPHPLSLSLSLFSDACSLPFFNLSKESGERENWGQKLQTRIRRDDNYVGILPEGMRYYPFPSELASFRDLDLCQDKYRSCLVRGSFPFSAGSDARAVHRRLTRVTFVVRDQRDSTIRYFVWRFSKSLLAGRIYRQSDAMLFDRRARRRKLPR